MLLQLECQKERFLLEVKMAWIKLGTKNFQSDLIAAYESAGKDQTKIWLSGSSPVDGAFLVPLPEEAVTQALTHARYQEVAEDLFRNETAEERDDALGRMHGG